VTRRAAVIGCGFIGAAEPRPGAGIQSHAAAWIHHPGVELVALCDSDSSRLAGAAVRWKVRNTYTDAARMLRETAPEIVSLCTPDPTHASLLSLVCAAPSVRAVLAEKPLALEVDEAERLVDLAERREIVLAVNYVRRYAPSHRALKRWLDDEPLGGIELVRGTYTRGLKHNGTHWLDLARFLVGEIESVTGSGRVEPDARDATIDVALELSTGARGMLHGLEVPYSLFEIELLGERGRVRVFDGGQRFEVAGVAPSRRFPGFRELIPMVGPNGGLSDLLMHAASDLVEALATGRSPACTGADAVEALRVAQVAIDSARARNEEHVGLGR